MRPADARFAGASRLRIAFDGRAFSSPAGGVRRYVTELADALSLAGGVSIAAVGAADAAALPAGATRVPAAPTLPSSLGWALTGLPWTARRTSFDVFHAPAYIAPLWGVRPLVVTIHDVSYARHPAWYPYRSDWRRQVFYRASARRADRIITDSDFSRREIMAAYGLAADRIAVIPLGVNPRFAPDESTRREPFVLHVGDVHERRNLAMLLDVILDLRRHVPGCASVHLVLAGVDRGLLGALSRRAADAGAPDALRYAGSPDDEELVRLYRRAAVFAYPSRYEGFGLPVLEAMACGAPVVATTSGAVPEVAGPDVIGVDPDDAAGWRRAIAALLADPGRAMAASRVSLERARRFSWDHTAATTLDVYRQVTEQARKGMKTGG